MYFWESRLSMFVGPYGKNMRYNCIEFRVNDARSKYPMSESLQLKIQTKYLVYKNLILNVWYQISVSISKVSINKLSRKYWLKYIHFFGFLCNNQFTLRSIGSNKFTLKKLEIYVMLGHRSKTILYLFMTYTISNQVSANM